MLVELYLEGNVRKKRYTCSGKYILNVRSGKEFCFVGGVGDGWWWVMFKLLLLFGFIIVK